MERHRAKARVKSHRPAKEWAWPGTVVALAYTALGADMILQPDRFSRTPAYANLTLLLDTEVWGVLHLLVAALLAGYLFAVPNRRWAIFVHTAAALLTLAWLLAFVIRRVTDSSTTIVTVVAWSVFGALLYRSLTLIDDSTRARQPAAVDRRDAA